MTVRQWLANINPALFIYFVIPFFIDGLNVRIPAVIRTSYGVRTAIFKKKNSVFALI